jgi:predicted PurR-regulated permease PerM
MADSSVHRRSSGWRNTAILRTAALVIAMYVVLRMLYVASQLVLTVFLAVLFGLALAAAVDKLQRWRVPRGLGAGLVAALVIAILVGFGAWMAPTLRAQGAEIRQKLPEALDRLQAWTDARENGIVGTVLGLNKRGLDSTSNAVAGARGAAITASAAGAPPDSGPPSLMRETLGKQFGGITRYLFPFVHSAVTVIVGLLLVIVLSIYIAADPELYHRGALHLFPHRVRTRASEVLSAVAQVLRRWLVTQLIAMIVMGVATTIVLLLLHVPAPFALGVLAGLFEFIPTVGPILSGVPAVGMAFVDSPQKALYVTLVYIGLHFAESHLLIPLLMRGGLDLPPAVTVVCQALMALLFGFLGLMVAVPLTAAVMVTVRMLYVEGVVGDAIERSRGEARAESG